MATCRPPISRSCAALCGFALPRSLFGDLGERFDETLSGASDWDLLVRAVSLCGLRTAHEVGIMRRRWADRQSGTRTLVPREITAAVAALDRRPMVLDRGLASQVIGILRSVRPTLTATHESEPTSASRESLLATLGELETAKSAAEAQLAELRASTSWRVTGPFRALARMLRDGSSETRQRKGPQDGSRHYGGAGRRRTP